MSVLYRPLARLGAARPASAVGLAGGWAWFSEAERLERGGASETVPVSEIPSEVLERLCAPRAPIAGLTLDAPRLMGILNVTPDSFSDGGVHFAPEAAAASAAQMVAAGVDLLDIGGESTRPGAVTVPVEEEVARVLPAVQAIRAISDVALSIDTRKAPVARAALDAGANLINDVSGFSYDGALAPLCAETGVPVCVMHAQGDPATMQADPRYDDVVQDVYAYLEGRVAALVAQGIPAGQILVDPGIGFGKTEAHNLALLKNIAVFHGLGCPILLGVSRKRFIGVIGDAPNAADRAPGSIAVGLAALGQGVQVLRVHDVAQTAQAMRLWAAVH